MRRQLGLPKLPHTSGPTCPPADVRDIYFGLLGPDAIKIAYHTPDGRLRTEPTAGPQGAYLVVQRHNPRNQPSIGQAPSITDTTPIVGVAWHTGNNCGVLGPQNRGRPFFGCQIHDYKAPATAIPSAAAVRSPLTVHRLPSRPRQYDQVTVSFRAPIAIHTARSHYAIQLTDPPHRDPGEPHDIGCGGAGMGSGTNANIHRGQLVKLTIGPGLPCYGIARGVVELVIEPGPQGGGPPFAIAGGFRGGIGRVVGHFSYHVPR